MVKNKGAVAVFWISFLAFAVITAKAVSGLPVFEFQCFYAKLTVIIESPYLFLSITLKYSLQCHILGWATPLLFKHCFPTYCWQPQTTPLLSSALLSATNNNFFHTFFWFIHCNYHARASCLLVLVTARLMATNHAGWLIMSVFFHIQIEHSMTKSYRLKSMAINVKQLFGPAIYLTI